MADHASTSVIIPAFNEAASIKAVVSALDAVGPWHQLIVVDDGSSDDTTGEAKAAGASVVRHPYNKGNGAAVKSGVRSATGEYILIIDADGQHQPDDARRLLERLGQYDLVVGARSSSSQASAARRVGNALLNWFASYLTGRRIPDLTSGFRAARRSNFREFLHLVPNGFSTPTTTTLAFIKAGYSVDFVMIDANRRTGRSKIRFARDGAKFFLILLKMVTIFSPLRIFIPISVVTFLLGAGYALWTVLDRMQITNSSVLLIMLSVVIFLVGLVSEQVAALRFESRS